MSTSVAPNCRSVPPNHPPSRRGGRVVIGRAAGGSWIVCDECGLSGGIFADRAAAMHFAIAECDYDPAGILAAPDGALSLDTLFYHDRAAPKDRKLG